MILPLVIQRTFKILYGCRPYGVEVVGGPESDEPYSGTSVFDPVLCEVAYRWFSPPGGHVLDPFAGGSVRGILAA